MNKIYLENCRQIFLHPDEKLIYEGKYGDEFNLFREMVGLIIPNRITPEELVIYLEIITKDIKNNTCGFKNSKQYAECFENYIESTPNHELWMTYFPGFAKAISPKDFYDEFIVLFKKAFYELEDTEDKDYGYIEVEEDYIDISNKNKADVLAALYNNAKPIGMGIIHYDPTPMTREQAQYILDNSDKCFSYLKGRVMYINLNSDILYVYAYNRDNNQDGLAQRAIATCPNVKAKQKTISF